MSSIIEPKKMTLAALHLEDHLPATLTTPGLSEAQFLALAEDFPDCLLEYTAEGTVLIMPPTDPASSERVNEVVYQLTAWAKADKRGRVFGPDGGFFLRDGSRLSPDATWVDRRRWEELSSLEDCFQYLLQSLSSRCGLPSSAGAPYGKRWTSTLPTESSSAG